MESKAQVQQWIEGFRDAYAGLSPRVHAVDNYSYPSGRQAGEALRVRQQRAVALAVGDRDPEGQSGFEHGYHGGRSILPSITYQEAFAEGCALRAEHESEFEQALFNGRRVRPCSDV